MDALGLPRRLHRLHEFQFENQWYIADLDEGIVLPAPEPMRQILHLCESHTRKEILEKLRDTFDRGYLERIFLLLEALDMRGYLFSSVNETQSTISSKRLHLCVSPNFLLFKPQTGFITRWVHYNLLTALTKYADVSLILPKLSGDLGEETLFPSEGVERVPVSEWSMRCILQAVPSDCDGVLLLSPLSTIDLMWYRHVDLPVVSYIQNETLSWRTSVNVLIQHASVMREFDAITGDAPWILSFLRDVVEEVPPFTLILPGTDNLPAPPKLDKDSFRKELQARFTYKTVGEKLVGLSLDLSEVRWRLMIPELCLSHQNWTFISLHSLTKPFIGDRLQNLLWLDLTSHHDLMVLNAFLSRMDAFIYQNAPGIPVLPLLMALNAGCFCVVLGEFHGLIGERDALPHLTFLESYATAGNLSDALVSHLKEERVKREPISFSWMESARTLVQVFHRCHGNRFDRKLRYVNVNPVFKYHYVKSRGAIEVAAFLLPDLSNVSFESALKLTMEREFSSNEIQTVLKYMCLNRGEK